MLHIQLHIQLHQFQLDEVVDEQNYKEIIVQMEIIQIVIMIEIVECQRMERRIAENENQRIAENENDRHMDRLEMKMGIQMKNCLHINGHTNTELRL